MEKYVELTRRICDSIGDDVAHAKAWRDLKDYVYACANSGNQKVVHQYFEDIADYIASNGDPVIEVTIVGDIFEAIDWFSSNNLLHLIKDELAEISRLFIQAGKVQRGEAE